VNSKFNLAASYAAISILACASVKAQSDDQSKRDAQAVNVASCNYLKASDVVGAKVYSSASAEQQKVETALGEVKDIIVDTNAASGHGSFAVMADGELFTIGTAGMHGVSSLNWDIKTRRFGVSTAMPSKTLGNMSEKQMADANWEHRRTGIENGNGVSLSLRAPSRLLMFSGLKGLKVYPEGSKDSFGKVDDVWIDTARGCTGYLVVSSGGVLGVGDTTRLVPWAASTLGRSADMKDNQINIRATREMLEAAPKVDGKSEPNDANLRAHACKTFNCEDPAKSVPSKDIRPGSEGVERLEAGIKK